MVSESISWEAKLSLSKAQLKARLMRAAVAMLVLGLASALLIYAFVDENRRGAIGYVVIDGLKYPVEPGQSKRHVREIERWFAGLWGAGGSG